VQRKKRKRNKVASEILDNLVYSKTNTMIMNKLGSRQTSINLGEVDRLLDYVNPHLKKIWIVICWVSIQIILEMIMM